MLNKSIEISISLILICSIISFMLSEMASMTSLIIVWSMIILPLILVLIVINFMFSLLKSR